MRSFPQARRQGIHSATIPTAIKSLEFENGILKRVIYYLPRETSPKKDRAPEKKEDAYYIEPKRHLKVYALLDR